MRQVDLPNVVKIKKEETLEEFKMNVWIKAWCSTASASDCKDAKVATVWADKCLKDFEERFKTEEEK